VNVYTWRPGTYLARFEIASYGHPRVVRVLGGKQSARAFVVSGPRFVTFPVRLPRGLSKIELAVRPGPEQVPDGRRVTVYVSNWRFSPAKATGGRAIEAIPE
jgi:hypothetical protein